MLEDGLSNLRGASRAVRLQLAEAGHQWWSHLEN